MSADGRRGSGKREAEGMRLTDRLLPEGVDAQLRELPTYPLVKLARKLELSGHGLHVVDWEVR